MKKVTIFFCVTCLTLCSLIGFSVGTDTDGSRESLLSRNAGWDKIEEFENSEGGFTRYHKNFWLMYFLHWRPLTPEKEKLSAEYVGKLLLSFWGNMLFEMIGPGGEMTIAGHKAYFADAEIKSVPIRTRFIVWNCPETKRQIIADTNINLRMGTPKERLELQKEITKTISCHGEPNNHSHPELTQQIKLKKFNISFKVPVAWRTKEYPSKKWFPHGLNETNGTLWTLPTDSEKFIHYQWWNSEEKASPELLSKRFIKAMSGPVKLSGQNLKITEVKLQKIRAKKGYYYADGTFNLFFKSKKYEGSTLYVCRVFMWNDNNKTFLIVASMVAHQDMWGNPNDLTPSDNIFDSFIEEISPLFKK